MKLMSNTINEMLLNEQVNKSTEQIDFYSLNRNNKLSKFLLNYFLMDCGDIGFFEREYQLVCYNKLAPLCCHLESIIMELESYDGTFQQQRIFSGILMDKTYYEDKIRLIKGLGYSLKDEVIMVEFPTKQILKSNLLDATLLLQSFYHYVRLAASRIPVILFINDIDLIAKDLDTNLQSKSYLLADAFYMILGRLYKEQADIILIGIYNEACCLDSAIPEELQFMY